MPVSTCVLTGTRAQTRAERAISNSEASKARARLSTASCLVANVSCWAPWLRICKRDAQAACAFTACCVARSRGSRSAPRSLMRGRSRRVRVVWCVL
eukprot:15433727-Alexandrium_andersonii.AAC.1